MSRVNTYLNFPGRAEEAFNFYATLFGSTVEGLTRFADAPDLPPLSDEERQMVLHVELPIFGGHVLMATDMLASMGHELRVGNNTTISLEVDSQTEADRLYDALSEGGAEGSGMQQMFFGYWGSCLDRYGVRWMINYRA
ncbi:MAG: VOC family protein [Acidobacteriota bacterium]|nr:VOC family protein [Acidobacteriota bacterium]MDE3044066.1 VOC family protein [Acidobacteriota bacterium]MDE3107716.1 VOC family protein [Acidobacteriota bacterium]MDE3222857.1 VOC family protein [Acidobacteriota bacterium]